MSVLTRTQLHELVENELSWDPEITSKSIGVVTLSGYVASYAERMAAERAALRIQGVRARRSAETDASHIRVFVNNSEVKLVGEVRSFVEKQDAERAAWAAPGVTKVENQIAIVP